MTTKVIVNREKEKEPLVHYLSVIPYFISSNNYTAFLVNCPFSMRTYAKLQSKISFNAVLMMKANRRCVTAQTEHLRKDLEVFCKATKDYMNCCPAPGYFHIRFDSQSFDLMQDFIKEHNKVIGKEGYLSCVLKIVEVL